MSRLQDLIRFENASSAVSFRECAYGKSEQPELLRDVIALANAPATGPRFLFLGVSDRSGPDRTFPGVSARVWNRIKEVAPILLARAIEPPLRISVRDVMIGDALIGAICLDDCDDPPYLLRRRVSSSMPPGSGWIRRGTKQLPLLRNDLQQIFEAKSRVPKAPAVIRVGFPGRVLREEIILPVMPLDALPSAIAARRLVKMLEARRLSKTILGRTDTRIARLVHAQVSNDGDAYQSRGTTTLRQILRQNSQEHELADEHYQFETRTHMLNLRISNLTDLTLSNIVLVLKIPRLEGAGVAEKIHAAPGEKTAQREGYPLVDSGPRTITVQADGISIPTRATVDAFREPLRLWLRQPAAGKTIPLTYSLHGRGLSEPVHGTVRIYVTHCDPVTSTR